MEKNDASAQKWLKEHLPAFVADATEEEFRVVSHTLVYSEELEEYVFLNFRNTSFVVSLDRPDADQMILKHYGEQNILEYRSFVTAGNLVGYQLPLRITRVCFQAAQDAAEKVMPCDIKKELVEAALLEDQVQTKVIAAGPKATLYFAWRNVQKRFFLFRFAQLCKRHNIKISNLRFAYIDPLSIKCILLGSIVMEGDLVADNKKYDGFAREFELLKNSREDILTPLVESATITGNQANVLRALATLIEQILSDVNAALFPEDMCAEAFSFHPELTLKLLALFSAKFHPVDHNLKVFAERRADLVKALTELDTGRKKHDDRRRAIFEQALNIIDHCLRTNAYSDHRVGISFRLNPAYMDNVKGFDRKTKYPELPFSVFFIKGWNYFGFHIRFRDLARGGMRTVISRDQEHAKYERTNMFTENYNLAYTQQKKNKDIPEGGSKSICFLYPNEELPHEREIVRKELEGAGMPADKIKEALAQWTKEQTMEYLYYNQRCFLNTFLKLIIWDFEAGKLTYGKDIVDYLNLPEYLYLGPDENMHDCQIQWLAKEAVRLGYYSKGAFISGKEPAGINHKEYGVTSWGVLQYVKHVMKYLGLDKKERVTFKVTGGPDGDVAGNMIKLLGEHLKKQTQLLVITDASGTIYDPEGLDLDALTVMFHKVQPVAEYPPEKLHNGSFLLCLWKTRDQGTYKKETLMYEKKDGKLVETWVSGNIANQIFRTNAHVKYADIMVPGGGRPRTLSMLNVNDFLDKDGKPTALAMVEGANLYITQDAREYLEDHGLLIIKDSSANKCGVVSSSYEILAGLTLTDEQFAEIKPELVKNVLSRLEKIANDEAAAMIEYWVKKNKQVKLSAISELVSEKINRFTDDIAAFLKPLDLSKPENKKYLDVFINYVPECIKKNHLEVCLKRVPDMHKKAVISTDLACKLVYGKGLDWEPSVVDVLPSIL
eukprot:TRINITY_DN7_c0_g1_i2.p2 TRINITY_DN7_c0_g1~~TRINITY_DN7_c0_g1_i2.p2  ORF type:complete len:945 (+),score=356.57 TRINITY_DN7_c0_g1_i2:116-2950(+)